jgi:ribonuclease BN (tRNA processing enzyme)
MGFPVFSPLFLASTKLRIQGPVSYESDTLESILRNQLSYRYWPVRLDELAAHISYKSIREDTQDLGGGLRVTAKYLNHPILCLGYRFEYQGKSIATAYDHEPFRNIFPTNPEENGYDEDVAREGELAAEAENEKMFAFFKGAGILIHDCQYTAEEYKAHLGWGHSSYEHTLAIAQEAGINKLVFFHHEPARTDEELAALEKHYQEKAKGSGVEVIMAREGMTLEA